MNKLFCAYLQLEPPIVYVPEEYCAENPKPVLLVYPLDLRWILIQPVGE